MTNCKEKLPQKATMADEPINEAFTSNQLDDDDDGQKSR
jgi:hypothetical protein